VKFVATIDGPAAAGKSTTARAVAASLGFLYVDTGALYRALALKGLGVGLRAGDESALNELLATTKVGLSGSPSRPQVWLDGEDVADRIRTPEVSEASSRLAALSQVRRKLVDVQRQLADEGPLVAEGRDLGTVVYPDAQVKIFLDADLQTRSRRRAAEFGARGIPMRIEQVREELERRDERDRTRSDSPLQPAPGATVIDTSGLSIEQQIERVLEVIRRHADATAAPGRPSAAPP
jgi:cytidylate kinase